MRTITLVLALLLAVAGAAHAQDKVAAGKRFSAGQQAFTKGDYARAAAEFQASYDISKDPVVLENIGESWDKAGDPGKAVDAYRRYVAEVPRAADRGKVETRIHELEVKHGIPPVAPEPITPPPAPRVGGDATQGGPAPAPAAAPATDGAPATPPPPASAETPAPQSAVPPAPAAAPTGPGGLIDEERPSNLRIGAWSSVAATVALLTAGAICGLAAQERADEITRQQVALDISGQPAGFTPELEARFKDLRTEGQLFNSLGIGLMAASGATAILSATLFILDNRAAARDKAQAGRVQLLPSIGATGGGLSARFAF